MKTSTRHKQFHVQYHGPSENWPTGSWALYEISGDDIALRIGFDADGRTVVRRDSWPGYVGTFASVEMLTAAMMVGVSA